MFSHRKVSPGRKIVAVVMSSPRLLIIVIMKGPTHEPATMSSNEQIELFPFVSSRAKRTNAQGGRMLLLPIRVYRCMTLSLQRKVAASTHIPRLNEPLHHHRGDEPRQRRREHEAAHDDDWYP
jgi:hypothetical protein